MAGHLMHRWNFSIWDRVAKLVAAGPPAPVPDVSYEPPARPRQRQIRMRPQQVDALVSDYESGLSVGAVARKHGINIDTATGHLKRRGIEIRPVSYLIPLTRQSEVLALRAEGLNTAEIAMRFGCSRSSVQRALRRAAR